MSSFFLQKSLFARVFRYFLTMIGSVTTQNRVSQSLFSFCPQYLLTKGLWSVHFEPRGVHLLIILQERKERPQNPFAQKGVRSCDLSLFSNSDFGTVFENKGDFAAPVDDCLFNHHCPDCVVPTMKHNRLFLESADVKRHFLILPTARGA